MKSFRRRARRMGNRVLSALTFLFVAFFVLAALTGRGAPEPPAKGRRPRSRTRTWPPSTA